MAILKKRDRLKLIIETMQRLGQANPKEIIQRVAVASDSDATDAAFVRNIYRDLKDLADEGHLTARYFNADGAELPPEEWNQNSNTRIEYSLTGDPAANVRGFAILKQANCALVPLTKSMEWNVTLATQLKAAGKLNILFRIRPGEWGAIQLALDQFPAKFVVGRSDDFAVDARVYADEAKEIFGTRTAILMTSDLTVSRIELPARQGHALLTAGRDTTVRLTDLNSKSGTSWAELSFDQIRSIIQPARTTATLPLSADPFEADLNWQPCNGEPLPACACVRVGTLRFLIFAQPETVNG